MKKKVFLTLLISICLSSCSVYKSKFDCPITDEIRCRSVSSVFNETNDEITEDKKIDLWIKENTKDYETQI